MHTSSWVVTGEHGLVCLSKCARCLQHKRCMDYFTSEIASCWPNWTPEKEYSWWFWAPEWVLHHGRSSLRSTLSHFPIYVWKSLTTRSDCGKIASLITDLPNTKLVDPNSSNSDVYRVQFCQIMYNSLAILGRDCGNTMKICGDIVRFTPCGRFCR